MTHDDFIAIITKTFPGIDTSKTQFTATRDKVTLTCPIHGDYTVISSELLRKVSKKAMGLTVEPCPKCGKALSGNKSVTQESVVDEIRRIHGDKYDYSKIVYITNKIPVEVVCHTHGSFFAEPRNLLSGRGCRKCYEGTVTSTNSDTIDTFETALVEKYGDGKFNLSKAKYISSTTKIAVTCANGHDFLIEPRTLMAYGKCPHCSTAKQAVFLRTPKLQYSLHAKGWEKTAMGKTTELYIGSLTSSNDNSVIFKVGVTTRTGEVRLRDHKRYSPKLLLTHPDEDSRRSFNSEYIITKSHYPYLYNGTTEMSGGGSTEAFTKIDLKATDVFLRRQICSVYILGRSGEKPEVKDIHLSMLPVPTEIVSGFHCYMENKEMLLYNAYTDPQKAIDDYLELITDAANGVNVMAKGMQQELAETVRVVTVKLDGVMQVDGVVGDCPNPIIVAAWAKGLNGIEWTVDNVLFKQ